MGRQWTKGRYRWRTRLRVMLPLAMAHRAAKGRGDCGNHEWYKQDGTVQACYHCRATRPLPDSKLRHVTILGWAR